MNILQQKQTQENQETVCKIHNQELIAVKINLIKYIIQITDQRNKQEQQIQSQFQNLQNLFNNYENDFEKNSQQLKKYCNIQQLENDLVNYIEKNQNLELEKTKQQIKNKRKLKKKLVTQIRGKGKRIFKYQKII
ncbi:unnamed protein product [Paramecium pentaurelia]|uniref:Uncharacterized protein n=1 Tax=Paramecium pentaurelia TaxID=43138 RepID=A0A8S1W311_9CILI|nr:unnamed protein product [Paramecium pentaurelia]